MSAKGGSGAKSAARWRRHLNSQQASRVAFVHREVDDLGRSGASRLTRGPSLVCSRLSFARSYRVLRHCLTRSEFCEVEGALRGDSSASITISPHPLHWLPPLRREESRNGASWCNRKYCLRARTATPAGGGSLQVMVGWLGWGEAADMMESWASAGRTTTNGGDESDWRRLQS